MKLNYIHKLFLFVALSFFCFSCEDDITMSGTHNGHEYVDLGLPSGLKWATCNIGASSPTGYGNYYAWGETVTKSNYSWSTYKYSNNYNNNLSKYHTYDKTTVLDLEDDAAHVNWGGKWRMPTFDEIEELLEYCEWEATTIFVINGYRVTSKINGNSIFLPATGHRHDSSLSRVGSDGYYWSSSLGSGIPSHASCLDFDSSGLGRVNYYRYCGFSVRAVYDEGISQPGTGASGSYDGHDYVDLALPSGLLWATCNVGAENPEDYGNYYAWGETETKDNYSWSTYKYGSSSSSLTKYNTDSYRGTVDNKTVLDPEDDAAHVNWGGAWRIPTDAEIDELIRNCTWEWTTINGKKGYKVISKINTDYIFLPAAGDRSDSSLSSDGSYGFYWSSSLNSGGPYSAWYLGFYSSYFYRGSLNRYYGHSVRAVCPAVP